VGAGLGMVRRHLGLRLRVGLLRPLPEDFLPELALLSDDPLLGRVRVAAVGHGVVQHVQDPVQTRAQLRPLGQTDLEAPPRPGQFHRRFILHEHLYHTQKPPCIMPKYPLSPPA
jgi:hypothetical protein